LLSGTLQNRYCADLTSGLAGALQVQLKAEQVVRPALADAGGSFRFCCSQNTVHTAMIPIGTLCLPLPDHCTAAYLALAVLGWGGPSAFFSHSALVVLTGVLAVLAGVSFFAGGNVSAGVREDRSNRWVIVAFAVIGLLDAYLPAYTDRKELWLLDGDAIRWVGVFLFAVGGGLRLWPVFVLGHRFSGLVAIQPEHKLVTGRVYSVIRHPSYLGLLINSLGWGLAFRSGVGVFLTALLIPPLLARINAEERLLRSQFGREYDAYRARTSRIVPGLY
jgi:protein-S-isoprenylcysteine O-methyltransferase Ste14